MTLLDPEHRPRNRRISAPGFYPEANAIALGSQRHPDPEEVLIISGQLYDAAFDCWLAAGHYASRPPGEVHNPFKTDEGRVVLEANQPLVCGD